MAEDARGLRRDEQDGYKAERIDERLAQAGRTGDAVEHVMQKCSHVEQRLDAIERKRVEKSCGAAELGEELDECVIEIDTLREHVNASTARLVPYDQRRCEKAMQQLEARYEAVRAGLFPRAKFHFKRKNQFLERLRRQQDDPEQRPENVEEDAKTLGAGDVDQSGALEDRHVQENGGSVSTTSADFCVYEGETGATLYHTKPNCTITLQHLERCTVYICTSVSALKVSNLTECKVFCGPVSGSAHISYIAGGEFHFMAHQIRIHTSRACHFFASSPNAPILEECTKLVMSRAVLHYSGSAQDCIAAKLGADLPWKDPIDFSWLADSEKSPHWDFRETGSAQCWVYLSEEQDTPSVSIHARVEWKE
ncbi:Tubulin-specific chaperone C [Porphyridium purpureum]|uniref:Tubulin-specific chaperone C n=1 Tax=Porphyridium purpureum TaxID=35688 RepID=A0A5J4Z519_PORPP|nr:Tubulin-specific chaperone C [Porphyridium purpureum]|eukprot:POR0784..scf295_1